MSEDNDGSVNEQSLALSWNIPRSAISAIRKGRLREHWHWKYGPSKNHGDVRITPEGIEELKKWVSPPDKVPKVETAPENIAPLVSEEEFRSLPEGIAVIHRVPMNPRMLLCKVADSIDLVSVRVYSNSKFRKGMKIDLEKQCVRLTPRGSGDLPVYVFKGRAPRGYGRW